MDTIAVAPNGDQHAPEAVIINNTGSKTLIDFSPRNLLTFDNLLGITVVFGLCATTDKLVALLPIISGSWLNDGSSKTGPRLAVSIAAFITVLALETYLAKRIRLVLLTITMYAVGSLFFG